MTRGSRKRRTRQHVIADLSIHHVEGFILDAGFTAQRVVSDYGYDLIMVTFDEQGFVEHGFVYFQLKASETLERSGADFVYNLDIRDYNLWMRENAAVVLVLYEATRRRAYWICVQDYFWADPARLPGKGNRTVRVRVPRRQRMNRQAIVKLRDLKSAIVFQERRVRHEAN